jgi:[ribosomal protein S18]-alanine N-acetyltransferase
MNGQAMSSGLPAPRGLALREMGHGDIDEVMRIERSIYPYPWTAGNFADSLNSGYLCTVAELEGAMAGYAVMMMAPLETHLLTIGIAQPFQRRGWGAALLGAMLTVAREAGAERVLLEVRPSNAPALALYRRSGFSQIGLRRGYYPADNGTREDAIVMECVL